MGLADKAPPSGKKVAVVGSGPGGLTAAGELAKYGHDVTVYEALHKPGGVLVYGIPEFRLPKQIVAEEVARLEQAGVKIVCNTVIGRTYTLPELREQFDAVFIANGAGLPVFMNVPGENFKGVYSANEYLTRVNLMAAYQFPRPTRPSWQGQRVATVGGGNVAMDSARTAKRLGAESSIIVYRRTRKEMPARAEEISPRRGGGHRVRVPGRPRRSARERQEMGDGAQVRQRMELGEPDASGRAGRSPIPGSEFVIDCDVVVVAIGTRANPLLTATCPDLKLNKWGNIDGGRQRHDQPAGRLRRRRHRARRGHRDPGHGRRQADRQGHGQLPAANYMNGTEGDGVGRWDERDKMWRAGSSVIDDC